MSSICEAQWLYSIEKQVQLRLFVFLHIRLEVGVGGGCWHIRFRVVGVTSFLEPSYHNGSFRAAVFEPHKLTSLHVIL